MNTPIAPVHAPSSRTRSFCQKTRRCQTGRSASSLPRRTGASQPSSHQYARWCISISLSPACSMAAGITAYCGRFQFDGSGSCIEPTSRSSWPLTKKRPVRLNATRYIARLRPGTASRWKCSLYQASEKRALGVTCHSLASDTVRHAQRASGSVSAVPTGWQNSACAIVSDTSDGAAAGAAAADDSPADALASSTAASSAQAHAGSARRKSGRRRAPRLTAGPCGPPRTRPRCASAPPACDRCA